MCELKRKPQQCLIFTFVPGGTIIEVPFPSFKIIADVGDMLDIELRAFEGRVVCS